MPVRWAKDDAFAIWGYLRISVQIENIYAYVQFISIRKTISSVLNLQGYSIFGQPKTCAKIRFRFGLFMSIFI